MREPFDLLIADIAERLREVKGLQAVVLGGSRARGTHTPASDADLGLYYDPAMPLDLVALEQIAAAIDDDHRRGLITPLGGWGPWINGGGWLKVQGTAVDFLYRDLSKVSAVIQACRTGQVEIHYQAGHPHGFVSAIYLAEVAICRVLWEKEACVSQLKALAIPYPPALRQAMIEKFAWEVSFHLGAAHKGASRSDRVYTAGCAFRAAACMLQVLFALNEQYLLNEKGAVALAESFPLLPTDLQNRIEAAFCGLGGDQAAVSQAVEALESLAAEVEALR